MSIVKHHLKIQPSALYSDDYLYVEHPEANDVKGLAERKGYDLFLSENPNHYAVNLLDGHFQCCGVMCPKDELQERINKMQSAIDRANYALHHKDIPERFLEQLKQDLADLSTR